MKKNCFLLFLIIVSFYSDIKAQKDQINVDHIRTLIVNRNGRWQDPPIIQLHSNDFIHISFDDLTHEYKRYIYKIEHCDAEWNVTESLLESDYIEGFNGTLSIDDYQYSINTTQLYTHYSLQIPNNNIKPLISGNYRLLVYEDNDYESSTEGKKPVVVAHFFIMEPHVSVACKITTNTDVDWNEKHQQIDLTVNCQTLPVREHQKEIYTVIRQNRRWDNAVSLMKPNYSVGNILKWEHNKRLIFKAGNEFRRFEMESLKSPSMGVDKIQWFSPYYHAVLFEDTPRRNYIYDEDQNGQYIIHNEKRYNNNIESDYAFIHFTLKTPEKLPGRVYLNGLWTNDNFNNNNYQLIYNEVNHSYEITCLMKQGYYNYQYIYMPDNIDLDMLSIEGDYYQTENEYDVFVYFRPIGGRYDQLVGYSTYIFNPNK